MRITRGLGLCVHQISRGDGVRVGGSRGPGPGAGTGPRGAGQGAGAGGAAAARGGSSQVGQMGWFPARCNSHLYEFII